MIVGCDCLIFLRNLRSENADGAPQRLPSPDAAVLLARPRGEPEAMMLREILAGEGIHALVKNRDAVSAQSGGMGPAWAYELWVLRKDLRRAQALVGIDGVTDPALERT